MKYINLTVEQQRTIESWSEFKSYLKKNHTFNHEVTAIIAAILVVAEKEPLESDL